MFTKIKNIDTAFQQVRTFTTVIVLCCILLCAYSIYQGFKTAEIARSQVYLIANGQAVKGVISTRTENLGVEIRDHVRTFHELFFTLDPDDKAIQANLSKALYLIDGSGKQVYDGLQEKGYYNGIISGNISQRVKIDSVRVDLEQEPVKFVCFARQEIQRSSSSVERRLITSGTIREVARTDNNPHGILIENWRILLNKNINPINAPANEISNY
ncbi:conjugative transposon protein TraK [Pelobium manganitolerans]|uniref:conjugative transposon protein TraK n=1 Tax=Pelobium manganitolerans TaxID=1842495 RepID=UPI003FA3BB23